jgi:YidC/Oxa1 family membrane protein insertase
MLVTANIFQPLIDIFAAVLTFFHDSIGIGWGWAIVLLTLVIRAFLVPLAVKQFHGMQRMQAHMPELKLIQAKYKDDKQRQQQEMMKFYKENQINPFASCLPLVAQIPVFISLFYMLRTDLRRSICPAVQPGAHLVNGHWVFPAGAATKACGPHGGASFLFIPDLTNHAAGAVLVVLILLYVGSQLVSSIMMSSPTMDKTQRYLLLVMPIFFVFLVIRFPAGVLVYWITTNVWTIGQQYVIRRRIGPMTPPAADTGLGPAAGGGPGGRGFGRGSGPNGSDSGSGGGLGALLRGGRGKEEAGVGSGTSRQPAGPPPPPPRKKKKRSGRRR